MPLGRRSPQECRSCCIATQLPQERGLAGTEEGLRPADLVSQKGAVWLCQGQKLGLTPLGSTPVGDATPMLFALLRLPIANPGFLWVWLEMQLKRQGIAAGSRFSVLDCEDSQMRGDGATPFLRNDSLPGVGADVYALQHVYVLRYSSELHSISGHLSSHDLHHQGKCELPARCGL